MLNYPEIIKKIDTSSKLNNISYQLNKNGFIHKGSPITYGGVSIIKENATPITMTTEELESKQKEQINFLAEASKDGIRESMNFNNFLLGISTLMIATSVLVKVPLFGVAFAYFGGISLSDNIKIGKLKAQIEMDKWFSDNNQKVNEELNEEGHLYQKLSIPTKQILTREGKITLNNIDEFPKNDLRLIRRNVSRKIKQLEKANQKALSR